MRCLRHISKPIKKFLLVFEIMTSKVPLGSSETPDVRRRLNIEILFEYLINVVSCKSIIIVFNNMLTVITINVPPLYLKNRIFYEFNKNLNQYQLGSCTIKAKTLFNLFFYENKFVFMLPM